MKHGKVFYFGRSAKPESAPIPLVSVAVSKEEMRSNAGETGEKPSTTVPAIVLALDMTTTESEQSIPRMGSHTVACALPSGFGLIPLPLGGLMSPGLYTRPKREKSTKSKDPA